VILGEFRVLEDEDGKPEKTEQNDQQ